MSTHVREFQSSIIFQVFCTILYRSKPPAAEGLKHARLKKGLNKTFIYTYMREYTNGQPTCLILYSSSYAEYKRKRRYKVKFA